MKISYSIDGDILGFLPLDYEEPTDFDLYFAAKEAARIVENRHDGWEMQWPVEIGLHKEEGPLLASFSVEKEYVPEFYPNQIS